MTFTPWKDRGGAVVSGLLLAAAFPPLNWWPLALVALVPLLLAVWSRSARRSKAFQALVYRINHTPEPNAAQSGRDAVTAADGQPSVDPCGQNAQVSERRSTGLDHGAFSHPEKIIADFLSQTPAVS